MHLDQLPPPAPPPSGLRRITPPMLKTMKAADAFDGLPGLLPGQVLATFKAAAPFLGLRVSVVHAIDWLFKFTLPLDWEPGSRPIVWPSAAEQQAACGLSAAQVKYLNRQLAELGLVIMRDSPNGRRYGSRIPRRTGPIVEAYGFDLSPLATRMAEFRAIAAEGRARQDRMKALRRRASIARNGLRQISAAAATETTVGFDLVAWKLRAAPLCRGLSDISDEGALAMAVASLERVRDEAREALRQCLSGPSAVPDPVETDPKGSENQPHITTTNESLNPTDTVIAPGKDRGEPGEAIGSKDGAPHGRQKAEAVREQRRAEATMRPDEVTPDAAVLKMTPEELTQLAPKLRPYLPRPTATWSDIVEAADWLRGDLSISKSIWGNACLTLGRERAAIAVAIVSAKPEGYFRAGPGAYFFGMARRAKIGELNLEKTIWGLRARMKEGLRSVRH
jgi:replication initiation protein RepC